MSTAVRPRSLDPPAASAPRWRVVLLFLLALIALLPCLARADILVTGEAAGVPGLTAVQRYSDAGGLLWSTPIGLPAGSTDRPAGASGLTLSADGATVVVAIGSAAGGALMLLDAGTGAITGQLSTAAPGQPFAGPVGLATAADGSYWVLQSGVAAGQGGTVLHLGADFALRGASAPLAGGGAMVFAGIAPGPDGGAMIVCCSAGGGVLLQFDSGDLAAAPTALAPVLPDLGGTPRGIGLRGDMLYVAIGANGAGAGQDRILGSRRDAFGSWGAWSSVVAADGAGGAGFGQLAFDTAGAILVSNSLTNSVSRFTPDGLLMDTPVTGLSRPGGLYYIPMPEPGSLALLAVALVALLFWRRHA